MKNSVPAQQELALTEPLKDVRCLVRRPRFAMHGKEAMDQFTAHLDRGWDLVSKGDLKGAMLSAQKGLELNAQSPEAHNLAGYIYAIEGHPDEALEHYRQAIELDEGFVEAMLNAAEVLVHPLQDYPAALRMVEDAIDYVQGDDELADAMLLKVDALLHQGDREAAARVVAGLPEGPFESPTLDFLVGRAKFELGDVDGAEPRIRVAVEREPKNPEVQYYMGLVLEARGDSAAATAAFLKSRELDLQLPTPQWALPLEQFEKRTHMALTQLADTLKPVLANAMVLVCDMPGAEVVADGVDPRTPLLFDDLSSDGEPPRVGRLFLYQRNIERVASGVLELHDEIRGNLEREVLALFPQLGPLDEPSQQAAVSSTPPQIEEGEP